MSTNYQESYPHTGRYTQSLKIAVVAEVLSGQISQAAALRKYGIRGHCTIAKWIKNYGYEKDLKGFKRIVMPTEKVKIKQLRQRVHQLEALVSDLQLESKVLSKIIELAEKEYKISIKKNYGPKLLTSSSEKKEK